MYKKYFIGIAVVILFIVGLPTLFSLLRHNSQNLQDTSSTNTRLHVAATIFPLYDITRIVAGDTADVDLILPPGASPHTFSFTPRQLTALQDVALTFGIGHDIDNWAYDALGTLNIPIVTVDKNITLLPSADDDHDAHEHDEDGAHDEEHHHGPLDPHYWLDLTNAQTITQTIADTLSAQDPEHASTYQQNAHDYIQKLTQEDALFHEQIAQLTHKEIITLHDAWYYFADDLGLTIAGTFEPRAGENPSPQYLAQLREAAQEHSGGVIFTEPQLATDSITSFAKDNDLTIAILDPLGGTDGRDSYLAMMRYNRDTVINALTSR